MILLAGFSAGFSAGCGPSGPTLYPVSGSVTFNGQPAEGAVVVFQPAAGGSGLTPSGMVGADGTFTLSTHPHGAGAPDGDYTVEQTIDIEYGLAPVPLIEFVGISSLETVGLP